MDRFFKQPVFRWGLETNHKACRHEEEGDDKPGGSRMKKQKPERQLKKQNCRPDQSQKQGAGAVPAHCNPGRKQEKQAAASDSQKDCRSERRGRKILREKNDHAGETYETAEQEPDAKRQDFHGTMKRNEGQEHTAEKEKEKG
ncbi:MAG: hypothetical protein IJ443_07180 [Firmicutes bacterium]|nr:hypothetical protein [Bacillota bacterium]